MIQRIGRTLLQVLAWVIIMVRTPRLKYLSQYCNYYYVITSCSPINQVNVSFDVDHIIPKERFVGNNMIAQTYRDSLINLAFLPTKDNISKKAKALNEITDSWLKLQISTYTGIKEAEFEQYSDIANIRSYTMHVANCLLQRLQLTEQQLFQNSVW